MFESELQEDGRGRPSYVTSMRNGFSNLIRGDLAESGFTIIAKQDVEQSLCHQDELKPIMPTDKSTKSRTPKASRPKAIKPTPQKSHKETRSSRRSNRVAELQQLNATEQAAVLADQKQRGISWLDEIEGSFEGDKVFAKICELGAALRRADRPKG